MKKILFIPILMMKKLIIAQLDKSSTINDGVRNQTQLAHCDIDKERTIKPQATYVAEGYSITYVDD